MILRGECDLSGEMMSSSLPVWVVTTGYLRKVTIRPNIDPSDSSRGGRRNLKLLPALTAPPLPPVTVTCSIPTHRRANQISDILPFGTVLVPELDAHATEPRLAGSTWMA